MGAASSAGSSTASRGSESGSGSGSGSGGGGKRQQGGVAPPAACELCRHQFSALPACDCSSSSAASAAVGVRGSCAGGGDGDDGDTGGGVAREGCSVGGEHRHQPGMLLSPSSSPRSERGEGGSRGASRSEEGSEVGSAGSGGSEGGFSSDSGGGRGDGGTNHVRSRRQLRRQGGDGSVPTTTMLPPSPAATAASLRLAQALSDTSRWRAAWKRAWLLPVPRVIVFAALCWVGAVGWVVGGLPTVSVVTGEAKVRSTYVTETAVQGVVATPGFATSGALAAVQGAYQRWAAGCTNGTDTAASSAGVDTIAQLCSAAGLVVVHQPLERGRNVICQAPALRSAAGGDALLLVSAIPVCPTTAAALAPPGGTDSPWVLLALGQVVSQAGWRGKDIVFAFLDAGDGTRGGWDGAASKGINAGAAALLAGLTGTGTSGASRTSGTLHPRVPLQVGKLRAAIFVAPWVAAHEPPSIVVDGSCAGGSQVEIDFLRMLTDALRLPLRLWSDDDSGVTSALAAVGAAAARAVDAVLPPARWQAVWSAVGRWLTGVGIRTEPAVLPPSALAARAATLGIQLLQQTDPRLVHSRATPHAAALRCGMDAVTLHPRGTPHDDAPATALGVGLERMLRSLTVLDERLHANARSYLLLSPTAFTSMEELALPAALAHLPVLALTALHGAAPPPEAIAWEALLLAATPSVTLQAAALAAALAAADSPSSGALLSAVVAVTLRAAMQAAAGGSGARRPRGLWRGDPGAPLTPPLFVAWLYTGMTTLGAVYLAPAGGMLHGAVLLPFLLAATATSRTAATSTAAARATRLLGAVALLAWVAWCTLSATPPPNGESGSWVASSSVAILLHVAAAAVMSAL